MFTDEGRRPPSWFRQGEVNLSAEAFFVFALFLEAALIVLSAVVTGFSFHLVMHDHRGELQDYLPVGLLVAMFYALPGIVKSQYRPATFVPGERGYVHLFMTWNFAFFGIAAVGFLTKSTGFQSRGWFILFYIIGLIGLTGIEIALAAFRREGIRHGWLTTRRMLLVGRQGEVERFNLDTSRRPSGNKVVATVFMPDDDVSTSNYTQQLDACVKCAVDAARVHNVTDIVVLTNWANAPGSTKVAEKLMDTPAAVHLAGLDLVEQFTQLGVEQLGTATTVVLRRGPLSTMRSLVTRMFDICVASIVLLVLAPIYLAIALLIKLDSKGPVFFRQHLRGFNQKEFRDWRFRSMTIAEARDVVPVSKCVPSVTRLGHFLRKWNIDQLPQLFNVIKGDMPLVGPRLHAEAQDSTTNSPTEREA